MGEYVFVGKVIRIGNSLGIIIPRNIVKTRNIDASTYFTVTIKNYKMVKKNAEKNAV